MNKNAMKRIGLLCLAGSMLSGCMMYRLEELRKTVPSGSPYETELSRLYMRFAEQEETDYDWKDSWYFADKGLMLAYGNDVGPEELENWNLDPTSELELQKARIRVMDALTPELKRAKPEQAAAIQFYFDCWVEQQEENWQTDDIAECRNGLVRALGGQVSLSREVKLSEPEEVDEPQLVEKMEPEKPVTSKHLPAPGEKVPFGAPTPAPKSEMNAGEPEANAKQEPEMLAKKSEEPAKAFEPPAEKPMMEAKSAPVKAESKPEAKQVMPKGEQKAMEPSVETASYAVFFEQKKPDISTPGKNVLKEVADMLKGSLDYSVILHIAKQGSADVSPELALQRLLVVRKALEASGVRGDAIYDDSEAERAQSASKRIELFLNE